MPVMSGQVMINHIREYEKALKIPKAVGIIVITGDPSESAKRSCLLLGANDFLTKPIRTNQLGESLKKLFSNQSSVQRFVPISETTILIIDDDTFSSDIIKNYCEHDFHVLQAYSLPQVSSILLIISKHRLCLFISKLLIEFL